MAQPNVRRVSIGAVAVVLGILGILVGVPSWSFLASSLCVLLTTGGLFVIYQCHRENVFNVVKKMFKRPSRSSSSLQLASSDETVSRPARQRSSAIGVGHQYDGKGGENPAVFTDVHHNSAPARRQPVWPTDSLNRKLEFGKSPSGSRTRSGAFDSPANVAARQQAAFARLRAAGGAAPPSLSAAVGSPVTGDRLLATSGLDGSLVTAASQALLMQNQPEPSLRAVRIAPPTRSVTSTLKESLPASDSTDRATVVAALKQSRKRAFADDSSEHVAKKARPGDKATGQGPPLKSAFKRPAEDITDIVDSPKKTKLKSKSKNVTSPDPKAKSKGKRKAVKEEDDDSEPASRKRPTRSRKESLPNSSSSEASPRKSRRTLGVLDDDDVEMTLQEDAPALKESPSKDHPLANVRQAMKNSTPQPALKSRSSASRTGGDAGTQSPKKASAAQSDQQDSGKPQDQPKPAPLSLAEKKKRPARTFGEARLREIPVDASNPEVAPSTIEEDRGQSPEPAPTAEDIQEDRAAAKARVHHFLHDDDDEDEEEAANRKLKVKPSIAETTTASSTITTATASTAATVATSGSASGLQLGTLAQPAATAPSGLSAALSKISEKKDGTTPASGASVLAGLAQLSGAPGGGLAPSLSLATSSTTSSTLTNAAASQGLLSGSGVKLGAVPVPSAVSGTTSCGLAAAGLAMPAGINLSSSATAASALSQPPATTTAPVGGISLGLQTGQSTDGKALSSSIRLGSGAPAGSGLKLGPGLTALGGSTCSSSSLPTAASSATGLASAQPASGFKLGTSLGAGSAGTQLQFGASATGTSLSAGGTATLGMPTATLPTALSTAPQPAAAAAPGPFPGTILSQPGTATNPLAQTTTVGANSSSLGFFTAGASANKPAGAGAGLFAGQAGSSGTGAVAAAAAASGSSGQLGAGLFAASQSVANTASSAMSAAAAAGGFAQAVAPSSSTGAGMFAGMTGSQPLATSAVTTTTTPAPFAAAPSATGSFNFSSGGGLGQQGTTSAASGISFGTAAVTKPTVAAPAGQTSLFPQAGKSTAAAGSVGNAGLFSMTSGTKPSAQPAPGQQAAGMFSSVGSAPGAAAKASSGASTGFNFTGAAAGASIASPPASGFQFATGAPVAGAAPSGIAFGASRNTPSAATAAAPGAGNLFGVSTNTPSAATTAAPGAGNIFGAAGGASSNTPVGGNMFAAAASAAKPATGNLFGAAGGSSNTPTAMFANTGPAATPGASMFGSTSGQPVGTNFASPPFQAQGGTAGAIPTFAVGSTPTGTTTSSTRRVTARRRLRK